jgi:hypothetical protein
MSDEIDLPSNEDENEGMLPLSLTWIVNQEVKCKWNEKERMKVQTLLPLSLFFVFTVQTGESLKATTLLSPCRSWTFVANPTFSRQLQRSIALTLPENAQMDIGKWHICFLLSILSLSLSLSFSFSSKIRCSSLW